MTDQAWVLDGALIKKNGEWRLIAGRCSRCGKLTFPRPNVCSDCWNEAIAPAELSAEGELYSFTVVHASRPGWQVPYTLGYIDLPEGVRICAPIDASSNRPVRIGSKVRLTAGVLRTDEFGNLQHSHRFEIV